MVRFLRRGSRLTPLGLTVFASLALAAPVAAQTTSERREAAEDALARAEQLTDGRGVRTGRELTTALAELATQRSALRSSDRDDADELLARPPDTGQTGQPGGPYNPDATMKRNCSAHFCVHWVEQTEDAPSLANADACPTPDYIDLLRRSFEQSYDVENNQLGWVAPLPDGTIGGDAKTDVYVKELNADPAGGGLFGYASVDPGQSGDSRHAFLVLDDDYAADEFPDYLGNPTVPAQVTAAHEYNHVLQFRYDVFSDVWMAESTATWSEDKVFPLANDFVNYMPTWASSPGQPLTSDSGTKMYGSAIWNHWLERRYGADAVRAAWTESQPQDHFAPGAYDIANGAKSFAQEFAEFAASTAAWDVPGSGIHDGDLFPGPVARSPLEIDAAAQPFELDHTAFSVHDIDTADLAGATPLRLGAAIEAGTTGHIALVGVDGTDVTTVVDDFNSAGNAVVRMPGDPTRFQRISAVVVNGDISRSGFNGTTGDWDWTHENRDGTVSVTQAAGTGATPIDNTADNSTPTVLPSITDCGVTTVERSAPVTPTPTPTPTPTATPIATPTPTPVATATSVKLSRSTTRTRTAARKGLLQVLAAFNKAGTATAKATVDRATAKRLKLGRSRTVGTGRKTVSRSGSFKVNVKLTKKARKGLKRQKRTVRIAVVLTFVPTDGRPAVTRKLTVRLKR